MTIRAEIRDAVSSLTTSERKIANAILADYPFTGLQPIQVLASQVGVSAPSITRFISKIGYQGFQDFQRRLIAELKEGYRSPLDIRASEDEPKPLQFLADYAGRVSRMMAEMADSVPQEQFDTVCGLMTDRSRNIFLLGGRVSDSIARYLTIHLRQIRARIYHMSDNPEYWPEHVLRMRRQDVVILFDFRRYQANLESLAGMISTKRQSTIVLITDKWLSPIARHSDHVVALPIDIERAWDTLACPIAFVEAVIVKASEADWDATRQRIEAWDELRLLPNRMAMKERNESPDET